MNELQKLFTGLLSDESWEVVDRGIYGPDNWREEVWTIESRKDGWGARLTASFLLDPDYGTRGKSVWAIAIDDPENKERIALTIYKEKHIKNEWDSIRRELSKFKEKSSQPDVSSNS